MTLNKSFNIASTLGYRENVDDDLSALVTSNPAQICYLHLALDTLTGGTSGVGVKVEFEIYADLYDLKNPGLSLKLPPSK